MTALQKQGKHLFVSCGNCETLSGLKRQRERGRERERDRKGLGFSVSIFVKDSRVRMMSRYCSFVGIALTLDVETKRVL